MDFFAQRRRVEAKRFGGGHDGQALGGILRAALRLWVKAGSGIDLVAPEFQAHGRGHARRIHVQNAAAARKLAGPLDLFGALKAAGQKLFLERFGREDIARMHGECVGFEHRGRHRILQSAVRAGEHGVARTVLNARKDREPLTGIFARSRLILVEAQIPYGEKQRAHPQRGQVFQEPVRFRFIGTKAEHALPGVEPKTVKQHGLVNAGKARQGRRQGLLFDGIEQERVVAVLF